MAKKKQRNKQSTGPSPNPAATKKSKNSTLDAFLSQGTKKETHSSSNPPDATMNPTSHHDKVPAIEPPHTPTTALPEEDEEFVPFQYQQSPSTPVSQPPNDSSFSFEDDDDSSDIRNLRSAQREYVSELNSELAAILTDTSPAGSSVHSDQSSANGSSVSSSTPDIALLLRKPPASSAPTGRQATSKSPMKSPTPGVPPAASLLPTDMDNELEDDNEDTFVRRDLRRNFNQVRGDTTIDDPLTSDDITVDAKNTSDKKPAAVATKDSITSASLPSAAASTGKTHVSITDRTPVDQPAVHPFRVFVKRYDLRINLQPSDEADVTLVATFKEILTKLQECDPSLILYTWSDDNLAHISKPSQVPRTISDLRRYISRARPLPAGGSLYTSIRLGHTQPMKDRIIADMGWWLEKQKHGLYLRPIQAENTEVVGWLLYSTRNMNIEHLTTAIKSETHHRFEVGLRHRVIWIDAKGPIPDSLKVYAIHVEVDGKKFAEAKRWFFNTYSPNSTSFPNGIKMRIVPEITSRSSVDLKVKLERLRNRQAFFLAQLKNEECWDIANLDFCDDGLQGSLRQILMAIKPRSRSDLSLFHSVDPHWQGTNYLFTYIPQFAVEAKAVIDGLLPFLKFYHPDHVANLERCFTAGAVERAYEETWDPNKYSVRTISDRVVELLLDGDKDFDFSASGNLGTTSSVKEKATAAKNSRPSPANLQSTLYGNATDSVGSLDTRGNKTAASARSQSDRSTQSTISNATQSSAAALRELQTKYDNLQNQLQQFILASHQPPNLQSAADTASQPLQDHMHEQQVVSPDSAGGPRAAGAGS